MRSKKRAKCIYTARQRNMIFRRPYFQLVHNVHPWCKTASSFQGPSSRGSQKWATRRIPPRRNAQFYYYVASRETPCTGLMENVSSLWWAFVCCACGIEACIACCYIRCIHVPHVCCGRVDQGALPRMIGSDRSCACGRRPRGTAGACQ